MIIHPLNTAFQNTSQRAAYSYFASLVQPDPQLKNDLQASAADFRAFLESLYTHLFQSPDAFGLPLSEDLCIRGGEPDPKQFKQVVKKRLDKPLGMIEQGVNILMGVGQQGRLSEATLLLGKEAHAALLKEWKIKKPFLAGLTGIGWTVSEAGEDLAFTCPPHAGMLPALKALAEACCGYEDARLGKFHFARGDFRALDGKFSPAAEDLYTVTEPEEHEHLAHLHQFFMELHYKPVIRIQSISSWEVQYQGPTKIKASPLLRIHYDPRHLAPLQTDIKCASANRIVNLVYKQPWFLQEDFARRAINCQDCNWCDGKKGLGPTVFKFDGVQRTICWFHGSSFARLNEEAVRLVKQYAWMHEELALAS